MISKSDIRWYNLALKIADESLSNSKHGVVIIKSGTVLSVSCNRYSESHPISKLYDKTSIHAEQRAISKMRGNCFGCTLYSARLHSNPISEPCEMCERLIFNAGIKRVVFHDGNQLTNYIVK